jgi:hypothetical protein
MQASLSDHVVNRFVTRMQLAMPRFDEFVLSFDMHAVRVAFFFVPKLDVMTSGVPFDYYDLADSSHTM